jgi:hypothetical protein
MRPAAAAVPPAPRCLPRAARRGGGLFAHAEACGFGHRGRHRTPISGSIKYRVLTRARGRCECCGAWLLLSRSRTRGPWRWTTSCPGTTAARTTSATCRPSASAAMPANAMQFAYARGHHRLPLIAGQLLPSPRQLCVLRAGCQRPGAAGERIGSCASPMPIRCHLGTAW